MGEKIKSSHYFWIICLGFILNLSPMKGSGQSQSTPLISYLKEIITHKSVKNETQEILDQSGFELSKLNKNQILNLQKLATFHRLITATSAQTGNQNPHWGIPYFWHYTNPNPRNQIVLIENGKPLAEIKPPSRFERYKTYASIDRTPDIFWSDFVLNKPKYRYQGIPDFYTFGWCSEREMAFKSILHLMGFNCQIVLAGNHVWSVVELEKNSGLWVKVDNTFDVFIKVTPPKPVNSGLGEWYNKKAISRRILDILNKIEVGNARKKHLKEMAEKI